MAELRVERGIGRSPLEKHVRPHKIVKNTDGSYDVFNTYKKDMRAWGGPAKNVTIEGASLNEKAATEIAVAKHNESHVDGIWYTKSKVESTNAALPKQLQKEHSSGK